MQKENKQDSNTSKIVSVILTLLIVGGAIFGAYFSIKKISVQDSRNNQDDEILVFFNKIKEDTGINFLDEGEVEFSWSVEGEEDIENLRIQGKAIEIKSAENEQYDKIRIFFEDNDFNIDYYNISAGTIGGQDGYKKENKVCAVFVILSDLNIEGGKAFPTSDKKDIEIKCGILDNSLIPVISADKQIRKIFAEKYKTKSSSVNINIEKEDKNHIRGDVEILDEFAEGGSGSRGIFLAYKQENKWIVVSDGNGNIKCELIKDYEFPEDMISDCVKQ